MLNATRRGLHACNHVQTCRAEADARPPHSRHDSRHDASAGSPAYRLLERLPMRCWACTGPIHLDDQVSELPIVGALVHLACYIRAAGHEPVERLTLSQYLFRRSSRAA